MDQEKESNPENKQKTFKEINIQDLDFMDLITKRNKKPPSEISSTVSKKIKKKNTLVDLLSCEDIKDFNQKDFLVRKYDKNSIGAGKIFFKYRYIMKKIDELKKESSKNDMRNTLVPDKKNFDKIETEDDKRFSIPSFKNNKSNLNLKENEDLLNDKNIIRNFSSDFLTLVEKSIIQFNLKKYNDSYKVLFQENIIESKEEFGEFLLVINGFDKIVIGNFLAKEKPPNENKEVLNGFIDSIELKYKKSMKGDNCFLECLRFLLSRISLPQDANLILQIMDTYSTFLFNRNKDEKSFLVKYPSVNAIYLLISTLLALNTMFTRKDIKNMNIIKKDQFLDMNKEIEVKEAEDIYDNLEKNPISMSYNYHDIIYQKMTVLVKEKEMKTANPYLKKSLSIHSKVNPLLKRQQDNINKYKDYSKNIPEDINEYNEIDFDNDDEDILNIDETIEKNEANNNNNITNSIADPSAKSKMKKFRTSYALNKLNQKDTDFDDDDDDNRQISFSYRENLYNFSDNDRAILTNPAKFLKLINKNSHHPRMFIVDEKLEKLTWAKEIEVIVNPDKTVKIDKVKGQVHTINISDIENVHNGIEKSKLISDYIKANPNESNEPNNFITINTTTKSYCIKALFPETALSWFKALKSLVIQYKNINISNNSNNNNLRIRKMKYTVKKIWYTKIIPNWDLYGNYLNYRAKNKITYMIFLNKKNTIANNKNILEKTTFSLEERELFITEAKNKVIETADFDYNEFLYLYNFGLPNKLREKLWTLLIGNSCGINKQLFDKFKEKIKPFDFEDLIKEYDQNKNTIIKDDNNKDKKKVNQKISDILDLKDTFIIKYTISPNKILSSVYNISQILFLMRPDFKYNKSILSICYLFILVFKDEYLSFCNLYNLICSTCMLQYYHKNERFISSRIKFFDYLLQTKIPKVSTHFKNLDISSELFLVSWFENIFALTLDYNTLRRVFDLFLLNGEYMLFQVAITIIKIQEDELLNFTISDVFKVLRKLPKEFKEDTFMEKLYVNDISLEYDNWKKNQDLENQSNKLSLL